MYIRCKYCGDLFEATETSCGTACPACAAEVKKTSVRRRECIVCGEHFPGGPSAKWCPSCISDRKKEQLRQYRERKKAGSVRPIGSTDVCIACGKPYTVNGGLQKYCPECSVEEIRKNDNKKSIEWNEENRPAETVREERKKARTVMLPCASCGKPFLQGTGGKKYCSDDCYRIAQKENSAKWERENRAYRNEYRRKKAHEKE